MKDLYGSIGQRIREARTTKSWTIQRLAEAVNIDPSFMGQIERGAGIPSLKTLARVAEVLRVPLKDFFDEGASSDSSEFLIREVSTLFHKRSKRERQRAMTVLKALFQS